MSFISKRDGIVRPADVLAHVPLFAGLPAHIVRDLASRCAERRLRDGAYLFRAEDPADRIYVLAGGALEVVAGDRVLNTLAPATLIGELAVLRGATRSAGVRARGEAIVLEIEARTFLDQARRWPELALALAREVADSFIGAERRVLAPDPLWAVVLEGDMDPDFALELARAAVRHGKGLPAGRRVVVLAPASAGSREERGRRIDVETALFVQGRELHAMVTQARRDAALVVVAAGARALEEILRECNGLVHAGAGIEAAVPEGVRRIELADDGAPSAFRVRTGPAAAGRVARLLLGKSVGVALGGGAARALVQLGVLQVMEELGVPIDFVAGSSMGAVMGALTLSRGVEGAIAAVRALDTPGKVARRFLDTSFRATGRLEGRRLVGALERLLGVGTIEELGVPFGAVTLDLDSGDEVLLSRGGLAAAVRASGAMPGLMTPSGRYADGGLVNLVPVDVARTMGAHRVVGVHGLKLKDFGLVESGRAADALVEAQLMALARAGEKQLHTADVAIAPDAGKFGLLELWRGAELIEVGRRAAEASAGKLRELADG